MPEQSEGPTKKLFSTSHEHPNDWAYQMAEKIVQLDDSLEDDDEVTFLVGPHDTTTTEDYGVQAWSLGVRSGTIEDTRRAVHHVRYWIGNAIRAGASAREREMAREILPVVEDLLNGAADKSCVGRDEYETETKLGQRAAALLKKLRLWAGEQEDKPCPK